MSELQSIKDLIQSEIGKFKEIDSRRIELLISSIEHIHSDDDVVASVNVDTAIAVLCGIETMFGLMGVSEQQRPHVSKVFKYIEDSQRAGQR